MNFRQDIEVVLFDLDGTLIDSIPKIIESFDFVRNKFPELQRISREALISHIGRPFLHLMEGLKISQELAHQIWLEYRVHNQNLIPSMPLFPGCLAALNILKSSELKMGIVTSKSRDSTLISIREHNLASFFPIIVAKEDTEIHKPQPEPLLHALTQFNVRAQNSVYVGDTIYDIQAAKAAGCLSAGALWGANHPELVISEEPTWVLKGFEDLVRRLEVAESGFNDTK